MAGRRAPLEDAQRLEKKGDFAGAASAYAEHLSSTPKDARAQLKVAELKERIGETEAAAEAFSRLADLHLADGIPAKAVAALRQAARLMPQSSALALRLAKLLVDVERKGDALAVLRAAEQEVRGDLDARLQILRLRAAIDDGVRSAIALTDALVEAGKAKEAVAHLRKLTASGGESLERLELFEKMAKLAPEDADAVKTAARAALKLSQGRRALFALRPGLDFHPEDPELFALSAAGLEALGELARALMVYREAARGFARRERPVDAQEQWLAVLRLDANDTEAKAAVTPATPPQVASAPSSGPGAPREISGAEALSAMAMLDRTPAPPPPGEQVPSEFILEIEPSELAAPLTLVGDPAREAPNAPLESPFQAARAEAGPAAPAGPDTTLRPGEVRAGVAAVEDVALDGPEPEQTGEVALPTRALVTVGGPEGSWALRALTELSIGAAQIGPGAEDRAVEQAQAAGCDLIVAPQPLLDVWRHCGKWLALGPTAVARARARSQLHSAGQPVLEHGSAMTLGELEAALARWGAPLELVGEYGPPVRVAGAAALHFHLGLARQRLGPDLLAQPAVDARVRVLVVGAGSAPATALGSYGELTRDGTALFESPAANEEELLPMAAAMAQALGLRGVGTLILAKRRERWAFDGMEPSWGPGGLAVEARVGQSLWRLALDAQRRAALAPVERQGVALAAAVGAGAVGSAQSVRVEKGADGERAWLCAKAPTVDEAAEQLGGALGKKLRPA